MSDKQMAPGAVIGYAEKLDEAGNRVRFPVYGTVPPADPEPDPLDDDVDPWAEADQWGQDDD